MKEQKYKLGNVESFELRDIFEREQYDGLYFGRSRRAGI